MLSTRARTSWIPAQDPIRWHRQHGKIQGHFSSWDTSKRCSNQDVLFQVFPETAQSVMLCCRSEKLEEETSVLGYWWTLKILDITQMMSYAKSISKDPSTEICHLTRERLSISNGIIGIISVTLHLLLHSPVQWVYSQIVHYNLQSSWIVCLRSKDSKNLYYSTNYRNDSLKHCGKHHLLNSFLLLSHPIPFFHSQALSSHNSLCNLETHLDLSQLHLTLQMLVCASSWAVTKPPWPQFHPVEFCSHTCSHGSKPERSNPKPFTGNLTQKAAEMLEKIPAQHMPQGNCLQENMAKRPETLMASSLWITLVWKHWAPKKIIPPGCAAQHKSVCVLRGALGDTTPWPKWGFRLGWQWGLIGKLI